MSASFEAGAAVFQKIFGRTPPMDGGVADAMMRINVEHLFGTIFTRPGLGLRDREMISVAVLAASGRDRQLAMHLDGALNVGVSEEELVEELIQVAHLAGWPSALNGLAILEEVLAKR